MKQKAALLKLILDLVHGVQSLSKFIETETTEETNIKGMALVGTVNLDPAKATLKALGKGFENCPFCDEPVRQISSHLMSCPKVEPVSIKDLFLGRQIEDVKKAEVVEEVKVEGPPPLKLKCNVCNHEVESTDEIYYRGFWEDGIRCSQPHCHGRLISNMTPKELDAQKAYRSTFKRTL